MFVNRERELQVLEERYASGQAELIILYGRRRVGKTALLRKFCRDKPHIFYTADLASEGEHLAEFSRLMAQATGMEPEVAPIYPSWRAALTALAALARERMVVVLDEFTYLTEVAPALPSLLQAIWDNQLQHTQIMLVLCGSYIGLMERQALTYSAPLYGRRTAQMYLQPFTFYQACAFLRNYSAEDRVRAYAVVGGMPAYLEGWDGTLTVADNIERLILQREAPLYDEPRLLLRQELRDPHNYFSILRALAAGRTRLGEIAQTARIESMPLVSKYLSTLRDLRLVERRVPVTENAARSRRGIHRIADNYLRFWFRFVQPLQPLLETGQAANLLEQRILPQLGSFVAQAWEEIGRGFALRPGAYGALPFLPERYGAWWDRDVEIDVIAVGEGMAWVGECKWWDNPVGQNVLYDLERKGQALLRARGGPQCIVGHGLFARSFTEDLKSEAGGRDDVHLITPEVTALPDDALQEWLS